MRADFSDQVYGLWRLHAPLGDLVAAARLSRAINARPRDHELVWVLPSDTMPVEMRFPHGTELMELFGLPVMYAGVDRPMLAVRFIEQPTGAHRIRPGAAQAMADYDRSADPSYQAPL
jgi:hypothetical protein